MKVVYSASMLGLKPRLLEPKELESAGIGVTHHFVGGLYAKETVIPAGARLFQHVHSFDHLSALMKGKVVVSVNGVSRTYEAPALLTIKAHAMHDVLALTDVVWACLHATNETDPDKIDAALVAQE